MIYLVSYDLNNEKNYPAIIGAIQKYYDSCKALRSQWFVCSNESAAEIYVKLKPYVDEDDWLLVSEFTDNQCGWLSNKAIEWLKNQL